MAGRSGVPSDRIGTKRGLVEPTPSRLGFLASSLGRRLDAGAAEPLQEGDQVRAGGAVLDVERVRLLAPPPWIEERFHGRNGSVVQEERLAGQIDEERRWNTPAGASVTGIHHDQLVVVLARRIGQWS